MKHLQIVFACIVILVCQQACTKDLETTRVARLSRGHPFICDSSIVVNVLQRLQWPLMIVLYDQSKDGLLHDLTSQLPRVHKGIIIELHEIADNNSSVSFLLDVHRRLFPRLNFLLLTNEDNVWDILTYVDNIDSTHNRMTDFNYHSKWLVWLKSKDIEESVYKLKHLRNVAFIQTICDFKTINKTKLMTLVHHAQTVALQHVQYTPYVNESVLFPALKYGYNGRKLIVSVTPEIDLALADITINVHRSKVMEYVLPAIYYDYTDIIYKEEIEDTSWTTLLRPFSPVVFMVMAGSAVWFFIMYVAAMMIIRKKHTGRREPTTVTEVLWFTVSSLCKQGNPINPSSQSIRVLVSAWLLFIIIVVAVYTANLTAAFTVRPASKPFESLRQLLDNSKYKIGMLHGSILTMILKNSKHPDYRRAWAKILEDSKDDPDVFSKYEATHVQKVIGGKYAFIRNDAALSIYMKENCGLQRLGISLDWQPVCLGVPKQSTLKMQFAETMRRLENSGIFEYWMYLHMSQLKHITCPSRQRSVSSSISLDDIKSGFVLLGAGVGVAVISLVMETLVDIMRRKCIFHGNIS